MYLHVYCFELNSSWLGFISLIEIKFYLMRVFLYVLKIVKQNKAVETMQIACTEVCSTEQPFAKDFCKYNVHVCIN